MWMIRADAGTSSSRSSTMRLPTAGSHGRSSMRSSTGWRNAMSRNKDAPSDVLALGIDAGGTETRWALARGSGEIVAEGQVRGFSALQVSGLERPLVKEALEKLAREVLAVGRPLR